MNPKAALKSAKRKVRVIASRPASWFHSGSVGKSSSRSASVSFGILASLLQHREWVVRLFLRIGGGLRLLLTRQQPAIFGKRIVRQPRIGIQRKADRLGGKFPDIDRIPVHRQAVAILPPQFDLLLPRPRRERMKRSAKPR